MAVKWKKPVRQERVIVTWSYTIFNIKNIVTVSVMFMLDRDALFGYNNIRY